MRWRNLPSAVCAFSLGPQKTQMRSPSAASHASAHFLRSSAPKNFLADESRSTAPSLRLFTFTHTRPGAPTCSPVHVFSRFFTCLVDQLPTPGQQIAPTYSASSNTLKSLPLARCVISRSFMPKRRSGLSMPYSSMAWLQGMRGKGGRSTPLVCRKRSRARPSNTRSTSSCVTNESSQSTCVNSGWRSARSSSSRKHLTIWKYRSMPATMRICLKVCGLCGSA
mmetsp:Transcript_16998/g.45852  ORF Transcript_16998/g.45852 Transcript_16998/m.45852 type:complete len:223 (+) Transcript_16998:980-1648(+)